MLGRYQISVPGSTVLQNRFWKQDENRLIQIHIVVWIIGEDLPTERYGLHSLPVSGLIVDFSVLEVVLLVFDEALFLSAKTKKRFAREC